MEKVKLVVLFTMLFASRISALVIESVAVIVAVPTLAYLGSIAYCHFTECCTEKWTSANITGLETALRSRLFGQHLVMQTVPNAVVGHLNNKSPSKALALSFNGWTGSGKNFVSKIIAEHIFKEGMDSSFVHQIIATHDYPHQDYVEFYKRQLRTRVANAVSKCPRSLFIFDEMDKMPPGLIDVLKPYLDHYPDVGKIDYRKSIFIFLSNTGAHLINNAALTHWKEGKKREDIKIKQMDKVINLGEFNFKGGFWHSPLIEKKLIDYFIPFLPMERSHIKMCAKAELKQKGYSFADFILNRIADELLYFPEDSQVFSESGCKGIPSKVDVIMGPKFKS